MACIATQHGEIDIVSYNSVESEKGGRGHSCQFCRRLPYASSRHQRPIGDNTEKQESRAGALCCVRVLLLTGPKLPEVELKLFALEDVTIRTA